MTSNNLYRFRIAFIFVICQQFFSFGCTNRCSNRLITQLQKEGCQTNNNGEVDLKEVYTEDWDELYIFANFKSPEDISQIIGVKYNQAIYDGSKLALLLKSGSIIREYRLDCSNKINVEELLVHGYCRFTNNASTVSFYKPRKGYYEYALQKRPLK